MKPILVIALGRLNRGMLSGKTVLITGGGGGIGYEAARALVYLGANVVLAEIDREKGKAAERAIRAEFGTQSDVGRARFFEADISRPEDVAALQGFVKSEFGSLDVLFNNATVTPMGAVHAVGAAAWDKSYAVHIRAAVLLLEAFLPDMLARDSGTVVFVPSSGAAPYMGAYEVFKTAQVELCNTLAAELENTNVVAYSIGPGLVKTDTALRAIGIVSSSMGISVDEFIAMNEKHLLDAETAGAGFAASVALAEQYRGKEISSIQALIDAGIFAAPKQNQPASTISKSAKASLPSAMEKIIVTYSEQYDGWLSRNIFERQWVLRDFKKTVGFSTDAMKTELDTLAKSAKGGNWEAFTRKAPVLSKLSAYYAHQLDLLKGYEKDPAKRAENVKILEGWMEDIGKILDPIKE